MKCTKCGAELNGQNTCPNCGSVFQPVSNPSVSTAGQNNVINNGGQFQNLNSSKNNGTNKVLILQFIVSVIVILLMVILVVSTLYSKKNNAASSTEKTIVCTKSGKKLNQSISYTYANDDLKNWEVEYKIDSTIDEDTLTMSERDDLTSVSFSQMAFATYSEKNGIVYKYDDSSDVVTSRFVVDFTKVSDSVMDELLPEDERMSYDETFDYYESAGFTCTKK